MTAALLLANSERAVTGLNMIVSGDVSPTLCSLDDSSNRRQKSLRRPSAQLEQRVNLRKAKWEKNL